MARNPSLTASRSPDLLGIYLNDHLAGATGGVELARRVASSQRSTTAGTALGQLARDIAQDRTALISIMKALGVPVRRYKAGLGLGRREDRPVKPNGHLITRSPLGRCWRSWSCCGWARRERPRAGGRCEPWPTAITAWTHGSLTSCWASQVSGRDPGEPRGQGRERGISRGQGLAGREGS